MSTIKTTYIQHPSAASPNLELAADGTVVLPLSGIGDLADVDEGSGAADGDVLTYDGVGNVWVPESIVFPAGIGSNVVQTVKTDTFTLNSSTYTAVTGLSVTITPTSASSKILLLVSVQYSVDGSGGGQSAHVRVTGGNAGTFIGDASGSRTRAITGTHSQSDFHQQWTLLATGAAYLDSPATTSATTYTVEVRHGLGGTVYVNRQPNALDNAAATSGASSLIAIEVAA